MTTTEPFYQRRPGDLVFAKSEIDPLPDGTTLIHGGDIFTKKDGLWYVSYDTSPRASFTPSPHGETAIQSFPKGYDYPHDTLEQYQFKVNDVARAAAARHGSSGVPETMKSLDVVPEKFPLGRGARIIDTATLTNLRLLPVDSLISYGHPDDVDFALWRRTKTNWVREYGHPNHQMTGAALVEEVGGVVYEYDWLEQVGDSSVDAEVNRFKVKMWQVGQKSATDYGWCGVFRQVLNYLGVNEQVVNEIELGQHGMAGEIVHPHDAAQMPLGTLFSYVTGDGRTVWYQRVSDSTNRAGTKRILCFSVDYAVVTGEGGHYSSSMRLLGRPGERVRIPQHNTLGLIDAMPAGVKIAMDPTNGSFILSGANSFGPNHYRNQFRTAGYWHGGHNNSQAAYIVAEQQAAVTEPF